MIMKCHFFLIGVILPFLTDNVKRTTMPGMNNKLLSTLLVLLGVLFIALAFVYWFTPAGSLPGFLPGFIAGSTKIHYKHGIGSFLLGVASFVFVWFRSGKTQRQKKTSVETEPTTKQ